MSQYVFSQPVYVNQCMHIESRYTSSQINDSSQSVYAHTVTLSHVIESP